MSLTVGICLYCMYCYATGFTFLADKIIQFSEQSKTQPSIVEVEVISTDDGKGQNDTKVLPSCDTLAEPVQLDRNNKSLLKPVAADMEKGTIYFMVFSLITS